MSELARTPGVLQRLFPLIDLVPQPRDRLVAHGLEWWREKRGRQIAPDASSIAMGDPVSDNSIIAVQHPVEDDFRLIVVGREVRSSLGLDFGVDQLSKAASRRLAVRLRRVLALALQQGEPVVVRFEEKKDPVTVAFEVLAAPVRLEAGKLGVYCAISPREEARLRTSD